MTIVRVELKVCEGCGALWVRPTGSGVYCRGCTKYLAEFPAPRGKRRAGRKPRCEKRAAGEQRGDALELR